MGLLDKIESMAGVSATGDHAKVAGGLIEEMQQTPGGMGALLQSFRQNGMGSLIQQWAGGQTQPANPSDVETGLGGGVINSIAQRTGLSPAVVKTGLSVAIPLLVHHMVSNNHLTADGQSTGTKPDPGGLLQSVLARFSSVYMVV